MTGSNILLAFIFLVILPILMGNTLLGTLKQDVTLTKSYLFGYIFMWAICQVVSVPLILMKQSFMTEVMILSAIYVTVAGVGIVKQFRLEKLDVKKLRPKNVEEALAGIAMMIAILVMVLSSLLLQHTDADDSRFVVNAVDIVRTNRMFLTDVNTGNIITTFVGDLNKDVTSPWAVFMAYMSKLTGIQPAIMMHTCMAPILTLLTCIVYSMIAEEFFSGDKVHKAVFVFFVVLLNMFGYYTTHTIQTVTMLRIWQGKATVAAIGIPLLLWILFQIFKENYKKNYCLLLITNIAMCLPSNMGVLIAGFMIGTFSVAYGIIKKNMKMALCLFLMCLVNVGYIGISYFM